MRKHILPSTLAAFGTLLALTPAMVLQTARGQGNTPKDYVAPIVFQAAGPTADSIQSTVDAFRAALGEPTTATIQGRSKVAARSTGTAAVGTTRRQPLSHRSTCS